jgi:hypothetical protein
MSQPKPQRPLYLSPNYTQKDWEVALAGPEDWYTAIGIVEDRIKGRWLDTADLLLDQPHAGFAILALDCIVLESLWGFMKGKPVPKGEKAYKQVYREILTGPGFGWSTHFSDSFHDLVRNGIMHDAETRNRWLVAKTVPLDVIPRRKLSGDHQINRTRFHGALRATFEDWITELRGGDPVLRGNMRRRMNQIITTHYAQ